MNNRFIFFTAFLVFFSSVIHAHAARLTITSPHMMSSDALPVTILVMLNPEHDTVGSIAGVFSFPSDLFDIQSISTKDSVVSSWVDSPSVLHKKMFDTRTRIHFSAVFPEGFSGVKSSFYQGVQPGLLVSVELVPKKEGASFFLLDSVEVRAYNSDHTLLSTQTSINPFSIPELKDIRDDTANINTSNKAVENSRKYLPIVFILIISTALLGLYSYNTIIPHATRKTRSRRKK